MSGTERIAAPCDSARPADENPLRSALAFYNGGYHHIDGRVRATA